MVQLTLDQQQLGIPPPLRLFPHLARIGEGNYLHRWAIRIYFLADGLESLGSTLVANGTAPDSRVSLGILCTAFRRMECESGNDRKPSSERLKIREGSDSPRV
jgi:hypothetical protein